ncbi:MAG: hypothetical protein N3C63_07835 [Rhodocyclaceae bacterium]|nr:hypothetical protein [Rhodocyclaceae bacterium]
MSSENPTDPMEFLKNLWSSMGFSLPGMVAPTLDTDELSKRIADLKAVEGWLKSNLSLLQMTIQGLEMQRATLTTLQQMSQANQEGSGAAAANPFMNPAAWPMPWAMMGQAAQPAASPPPTPSSETPASPEQKREPER